MTTLRTLAVDLAIAVAIAAGAWAIAVFSNGPGVRFVYFAF